jgi:hypothetical protein
VLARIEGSGALLLMGIGRAVLFSETMQAHSDLNGEELRVWKLERGVGWKTFAEAKTTKQTPAFRRNSRAQSPALEGTDPHSPDPLSPIFQPSTRWGRASLPARGDMEGEGEAPPLAGMTTLEREPDGTSEMDW